METDLCKDCDKAYASIYKLLEKNKELFDDEYEEEYFKNMDDILKDFERKLSSIKSRYSLKENKSNVNLLLKYSLNIFHKNYGVHNLEISKMVDKYLLKIEELREAFQLE